jgi:hypothetical protein
VLPSFLQADASEPFFKRMQASHAVDRAVARCSRRVSLDVGGAVACVMMEITFEGEGGGSYFVPRARKGADKRIASPKGLE